MLSDEVTGLRRWASNERHTFPASPVNPVIIGTTEDCWLRLDPEHASADTRVEIAAIRDYWRVSVMGGDVWIDGEPRRECVLIPGTEIRIGGIAYIAESARSAAMRAFCERILGWELHRQNAVDLSLRAVRCALAGRSALLMAGDGDLVPIAFQLFRRAVGDNAPFVVYDTRHSTGRASIRHPLNVPTIGEAFAAAKGGAVCVRTLQLPGDFAAVIGHCLHPETEQPLFICGSLKSDVLRLQSVRPVVVPPLRDRQGEWPEMIRAYADDSRTAMGAPPEAFSDRDMQWVLQYPMRSLWEMECAVHRLVALNMTGSPGKAAKMLGVAKASMRLWCHRHELSKRGAPMSCMPRAELSDSHLLNADN